MPATSPSAAAPAVGPQLAPHLQQALNRVTEIFSLPEVTAKIVEIVEDPRSTAQDMHAIVKNDPALAAKMLKVVNSAFYGLPAQIASLDRAIVMLGLSAVKNIALAASLSRLCRPGAISDHFSAMDLWRHSIAVGVCARLLAATGRGQAEEAFVAGLVHDVGLLIEYQLFADKVRQLSDRAMSGDQDFCALENELIGGDHQAFGAAIGAKWKFPPALRYAIAYHHDPSSLKPEFQKFVYTIHAADIICCDLHFGYWVTNKSGVLTDEVLEKINVSPPRIEEIRAELPEKVEEAESILTE